jgi:pimeloyl-ACP methyl ester carboxylesterase
MSDNWHQLASKLSKHLNVITVDQRNHGKSPHTTDMSYEAMADDVSLLMDNLNIVEAFHIGHSMGEK